MCPTLGQSDAAKGTKCRRQNTPASADRTVMPETGARPEAAGLVAGVDGCRGGWLAVVVPVSGLGGRPSDIVARPGEARVRLVKDFAAILETDEVMAMIAIDIPIGLPELVTTGGRRCDVEARAVLGERQSSVFAIPSRAAVMCEDYGEACRVALSTSNPPRKVSKQAFNLFPKIREVDSLMTPERVETVVECHPEVAFWALNGMRALDAPKKVRARPNADGLDERRRLLTSAGYDAAFIAGHPFKACNAGLDDLLDACAVAWTAVRLLRGEAVRFPGELETDGRGLPMRICG